MDKNNKHVVVLGGGFAGAEAAIGLSKKGYKVTLVSNRDFLFIYPISIWIPVGKIDQKKSSIQLDKLAQKHGFELIVDELMNVNGQKHTVELKTRTLSFDYLVIAVGAGKMKHKGLENTFTICGQPQQTIDLQNKFSELVSKGKGQIAVGFGGNPNDKSAVRGGPAFEVMFNFIHFLKQKGIYNNFGFTFFAPMPDPGKRMGNSGYRMLEKMLKNENIEKRVGKKIIEFTPTSIVFEDGSEAKSDLTMFIPASNGLDLFRDSDLPLNEAGFIKIDDHCKVDGFDNIFAIGDAAAIEGPDWKAKQGHMAVVMAKNAVYNIHQQITEGTKRKGYQKHLNILCVMDTGNGAAFVYRKNDFDMVIPMPIVGHWLKKAWGWNYKLSMG